MSEGNKDILDEIFEELKKSVHNVPYGSINFQIRIHQGCITDYVYTPFVRHKTFKKPQESDIDTPCDGAVKLR